MSNTTIPLDLKAAEEHLMRFLSVEGVTGQEAAIAPGCGARKRAIVGRNVA